MQVKTVTVGPLEIRVTPELRKQFGAADQQYENKEQLRLLKICTTASVGGSVEDNVVELIHHLLESGVPTVQVHRSVAHYSEHTTRAIFHIGLVRMRARRLEEVKRKSSGIPSFLEPQLEEVAA